METLLVPNKDVWEKGVMARFAERDMMIRMLREANVSDAAGAALAFLLHLVDTNPTALKTVLDSRCDKPGRLPGSIIDVLNRVSKG
jgi:hypothetical protein